MTIDPDVRGIAAHFGLDPTLLQSVVIAEGNILRAVQCSVPSVTTREKALDILARSCVHALRDYVHDIGRDVDFVTYWGKRWAPIGVANDPKSLNQNWVPNVLKSWKA